MGDGTLGAVHKARNQQGKGGVPKDYIYAGLRWEGVRFGVLP